MLAGTGLGEQTHAAGGGEDGGLSLRDGSYVAVVENRGASLPMSERPKVGSSKAARNGGIWIEWLRHPVQIDGDADYQLGWVIGYRWIYARER